MLTNISASGCCIELLGSSLSAGQYVTVKLDGIETLGGTVSWVAEQSAGLLFERTLYGPVLEHLMAKFAADEPVSLECD